MPPPDTPSQVPGTVDILSLTFREEQQLEKQEAATEKQQAKDGVRSKLDHESDKF
jgi:hypothetical protein